MTKTSLEMKKLVEEFIKITNVKYEDQTDKIKEKSNQVNWLLDALVTNLF